MISANSNSKRISFHTLGCRLNQSETAVIQQTFEIPGYSIVKVSEPADVVVINTCTVTENGDADTRQMVNKVSRLNPNVRIALIGCQAQVQKEKLAHLPNVFWVVGNAKKMDLAAILQEIPFPDNPRVITPTIPRTSFTIPMAAIDRDHTRANLKIQDGCDFFCSFCEIPYARGRARSREFSDILTEARTLVAAGHQEIVLTGINVGTYGFEEKKILHVIDALESLEGLARIRISSIEPTTIPFELFARMNKASKLCRYLHIPIQSGHNDILMSMKRKYTVEDFADFLWRVHNAVPEVCLGTDVIVGFPGEGEEHFEMTTNVLRDLPFAYFHVFSYSKRHMAKSQDLTATVDPQTINARSRILRDLSARKRQMFLQSLVGSVQSVLFEETKNDCWVGLTDNYARIKVKTQGNWKNKIAQVRLISSDGQTCSAVVIQENRLRR